MIRRGIGGALFAILLLPATALAQANLGGNAAQSRSAPALGDSSVSLQRFARAAEDSSAIRPRSLLLLSSGRFMPGTTLTFGSRFAENADRLLGFDLYRASRFECAYRGAGAGMTVGMAAGAFGMMTGAWNEREALCIGGAMAALGALYGGWLKADDPKFNLQIRWNPER